MPAATKAKDIAGHQATLAKAAARKQKTAQLEALKATHAGKKFGDFTPGPQQDDLLKMCALALGLVEPD